MESMKMRLEIKNIYMQHALEQRIAQTRKQLDRDDPRIVRVFIRINIFCL